MQRRGVDFVILEKADDIGGTWRDNTYPGCACDIPAHMYSYLVRTEGRLDPHVVVPAGNPGLPAGVTDKYGLRRYIHFGAHVDRARWDDDEMAWHVFTKDGREFIAQFLISGAGGLHIPLIPEFEGLDDYLAAGRAAFHSAQWDHDVDITGKRVAVIGTGASAIQIVPEIVEDVGVAAALPTHPGLGDAAAEQRRPGVACAGSSPTCPVPGRDARRHLLDARGRRVRDDPAAGAAQDR